ncbi:hypothetical protein HMPREF0971_03081 [Segatella oris F0302]|uniref:Uncharacterized protein n=1 Tax=Segatella oris F0302 TaxID=649760 RepID=D1QVP1_9BACT|nr:hypothetical protein HMPREF0971_03081 [Segatella oris F0302]
MFVKLSALSDYFSYSKVEFVVVSHLLSFHFKELWKVFLSIISLVCF